MGLSPVGRGLLKCGLGWLWWDPLQQAAGGSAWVGSLPANLAGFTVEPPLYPGPQSSPWQQHGLQSSSPSLEAEFLKTQQG